MDINNIILQEPIPIYTTINREADKNPNCYFIDEPQFAPFQSGDFIAQVEKGGSVNCEYIRFCAHGNGTHTECFGHISKQFYSIQNIKIPFLMLAEVKSVGVLRGNNYLWAPFTNDKGVSALILRSKDTADLHHLSQFNLYSKYAKFSGKNPPYIHVDTIKHLKSQGIHHLLTDLPSIDPEQDNGKLEAHLAFWGMKDRESFPLYPNDTITELCHIPEHIPDGLYMLHLGLSPFETDAVPSMPVLFPLKNS